MSRAGSSCRESGDGVEETLGVELMDDFNVNRSCFHAREDYRPNFVRRSTIHLNSKRSCKIKSNRAEWVAGCDANFREHAHFILDWPLEGPLALDALGENRSDFLSSMDNPQRASRFVEDKLRPRVKTFFMEIADDASHILVFPWHDDRGFCFVRDVCLGESASHAKVSIGVDEGVENSYF